MGCDHATRRSDPGRAGLCRSGKTRHDGRALHLPCRSPRPFRQDYRRSHASRRSVTEGRAMNQLGKLTWSAIPFDQPIVMGVSSVMVVAIVLILSLVTVKGYWPYLWNEWITSVD